MSPLLPFFTLVTDTSTNVITGRAQEISVLWFQLEINFSGSELLEMEMRQMVYRDRRGSVLVENGYQ